MDMWPPYITATRDGLPVGAEKVVFDRFHIMRAMMTAVDTAASKNSAPFFARATSRR